MAGGTTGGGERGDDINNRLGSKTNGLNKTVMLHQKKK